MVSEEASVKDAMTEDEYIALYEKLREPTYKYFFKNLGSREISEDLTQDTFRLAWEKRSQVRDNPRAWISVIARNVFMSALRNKYRLPAIVSLSPQFDVLGDDGDLSSLTLGELLDYVATTYPDQFEMFLWYISGHSIRECSEELGESYGRIKKQLAIIRKDIKEKFDGKKYKVNP